MSIGMFVRPASRSLRRRGRVWLLLAGVASLLAVVAASAAAQQRSSRPARITGHVVDKETGSAIEAAEILIISPVITGTLGGALRALADERGYFEIDGVPAGPHSLEVAMVGYQTLRDSVGVPPGTQIDLHVQLTATAIELAPVVVAVRRPMSREMQGFYRRRRQGAGGDFVTRADIEALDPMWLTDLLRRYPGLYIVPARSAGSSYDVLMRGRCRPALFINGVPAMNVLLNETLDPDYVEAIEIYRGPQTPARFRHNTCGALVVWTRPGGAELDEAGGLSLLQKVLVGAGLFGLLTLLSSL